MASGIYNTFKAELMKGTFNLGTSGDTIKVALMTTTHAFTSTHDAWANVSANEVTGTGYTAGGQALANQAVTVDDANNRGKWDADDLTWANSTITAYHAVIYDTSASNYLIGSIDFGGAQSSSSGNFIIQWDTDGIINLT
jgi:hypothetical protein